jgi:hypothetical protein
MPDPSVAVASVPTGAPARYAKQLAAHLGRRCEVVEDDAGTRIVLPDGECLLAPADGVLELRVSAAGPAERDRVAHLVGSHLERFGQRNGLRVVWQVA